MFCCFKVGVLLKCFTAVVLLFQEYGVTIYLRQRWCDPRLRHSKDIPLPPTSHYVSHLWLPDLIFSNAKIAEFRDVTFMNRIVDIDHDGTVLYVSRSDNVYKIFPKLRTNYANPLRHLTVLEKYKFLM